MERRKILEPFEKKRAYMDDRILHGIETGRKGFATLRFMTPDKQPLKNVHVEVKQKTHDFKVGANLFMLDEFDSQEQNTAYRELFASAFNIATLPFYWSDLEPEQGKPRFAKDSPKIYRRPTPDLCLEYCEANGIQPKVHCLNYEPYTPKWVPLEISEAKRLLDKRFHELSERYADRISDWEVVNEIWVSSRANVPFYKSPDFVEWSFKTAARHFPNNRLIINDHRQEIWEDLRFRWSRSLYYMQIESALKQGIRIDAIGMQFHMFFREEAEREKTAQFFDPERLYDVLDCYARLGLPIQITELTFPAYRYTVEDEDIQAEILRNIYSIWFSHPAMEAIIYWNLVDGFAAGAEPGDMEAGENYYRGGLIRHDFTPKPSYYVLKELFEKTWRTNLSLDSENSDELMFKGFYGEYELVVTAGDKTVTRTFHLDKQYKSENNIIIS